MEYIVYVSFVVEADSEDDAKEIVLEAGRSDSAIVGYERIDAEEI